MLETLEEFRPTWRRCAVGRTGWLWSERLPHGSFEEPENEMIGDLFKRRSGTVVNPMSQVNHLAEEMTLPSRLGHHQWGEDARHHHDRVWEESFIIFGRDDCVMFSYTGGSPLCHTRWSRLQTHSNVWKGEWPEEIARHVILLLGHLSIFGITWNNNWVPEWRKPKKTVAWGCQCSHFTMHYITWFG